MKAKIRLWLLLAICFSSSAQAQSIANVRVFSELDNKANLNCGASNDSAVAAVKAALRYNRISIADAPNNDFSIYLNINNFEVASKECAIAIDMQVYFYAFTQVPKTKKSIILKTLLCERGSAGYLDKSSMQSNINTKLKGYVDECVTEIENQIKK